MASFKCGLNDSYLIHFLIGLCVCVGGDTDAYVKLTFHSASNYHNNRDKPLGINAISVIPDCKPNCSKCNPIGFFLFPLCTSCYPICSLYICVQQIIFILQQPSAFIIHKDLADVAQPEIFDLNAPDV